MDFLVVDEYFRDGTLVVSPCDSVGRLLPISYGTCLEIVSQTSQL